MDFKLSHVKAVLANLNLRDEVHGDEHKTAADLALVADMANTALDMFDKHLLRAFFQKAKGGAQEDLTGHMPELRIPGLGWPIKFTESMVGATVTVHHGIGEASNVVLGLAGVDGFKITCKEGGSIKLEWRVQCKPDPEQIAVLAQKIGQTIEVSIEQPKAAEQTV